MMLTTPRRLLLNGILMSSAFAGLEGCVIAAINLSAAIVPPALAAQANGILYLMFSLGTFIAPLVVRRAGAKRSMVGAMTFYCLYLAAYIDFEYALDGTSLLARSAKSSNGSDDAAGRAGGDRGSSSSCAIRAAANVNAFSTVDLDSLGVHRVLLLIAAGVGGLAGSVMWVAQGVYFTRNALAFDAARVQQRALAARVAPAATLPSRDDAGGSGGPTTSAASGFTSSSITAFAGIFAFAFQLVTTLAKPTAALLLSLYPHHRAVLFAVFTSVAALCTLAMLMVAPLGNLLGASDSEASSSARSAAEGSTSTKRQAAAAEAGSMAPSSHAAAPPRRGDGATAAVPPPPPLSAGPGRAQWREETCSCRRGTLLHLLLYDRRALLLTPYNVSFGLSTAFFPSHITVLTKVIFGCVGAAGLAGGAGAAAAGGDLGAHPMLPEEAADMGPAAAGWMYTIAGLASALVAALAAVAAQHHRHARSVTMLLGSAAFATATLIAATAGGVAGLSIPRGLLGLMYVCYGLGVAAWQGSCMGLVGDVFSADPRAAFAHLKLTSGFSTFVGFFWLPSLSLRGAALVTFAANVLGAVSFAILLSQGTLSRPPELSHANDDDDNDDDDDDDDERWEPDAASGTELLDVPRACQEGGSARGGASQATSTTLPSQAAARAAPAPDRREAFEKQFHQEAVDNSM